MYGPRAWEKDPARRFGPPGRFPRRRSRSPPPPVGERYPFGEPFPVPPVRPAPGSSPYDRAMRPAEPPFGVRSRPEVYGVYDGRPPYRDINDDGYYNGLRRGVDRAPMDRRAMERSPLRYDKRAAVVERNDFRPPRYMMNDVPDQYPREPRRRDFPSPSRGLGMPDEPQGYPPEEYPPFLPPKDFGQGDQRPPVRRRSPEPRYTYRGSEKPVYPRGGWYRGPSPNRW